MNEKYRELIESFLLLFIIFTLANAITAVIFYRLGKETSYERCEAANKEVHSFIDTLVEESEQYHQILILLGEDMSEQTTEELLRRVQQNLALETSVNKDLDEHINMCNDVLMLKNTGIVQ